VALLLAAVPAAEAPGQVGRFYGEPVELRSNFIYFTSWKYVQQGSFAWKIEHDPDATEAEKNVGAWLAGDGPRPARFETGFPGSSDGLAMPVTWRGESSLEHEGAPVILRFQLRQTRLFGIEFH